MANEQLRERLARYIDQYKDDKESGVNMGTVGLAMGYKSGAAVVSAYLSGTYKGRVDTLEARLEEYFRNVEARTEQDSKLADIPMPKEYVKLSISERVFTSIRLAHMRGSIVAVVGDSGIGKTKAALEYNNVYPSSSYYLEATPVNGNLRSFLRALSAEMGLPDGGSNLDLENRIKEHLLGMNKVLIIDEAQNLKFTTMEMLKSWSDGDQRKGLKGAGLALIGNPDIESQMQSPKYDRHRNRRVHVEKCWRNSITKDDVRLLFPALAKEGHEKEFDLMYGMCRSWSAVRGAVYAYINAADSCRESGVEMDYNALFTQAQTINPTIGAGRL